MGTALLKTMRKDSTTAYFVRLDERRRADRSGSSSARRERISLSVRRMNACQECSVESCISPFAL
jgi:hypothetical protein